MLLSASTYSLVTDLALEVEDLGELAFTDFPAARRIYHLVLDGRGAAGFASIRAQRAGQTNLPDEISSFVGRQKEMATLRGLIAANRLVSLVGAGGVGKTRLASRLGSDLLDGSATGSGLSISHP